MLVVAVVSVTSGLLAPAGTPAFAEEGGASIDRAACVAARSDRVAREAACTAMLKMSDGEKLWVGAYLPRGTTPLAVLISFNPYAPDVPTGNAAYPTRGHPVFQKHPSLYLEQPALVRVHVRGTGRSSGPYCALCDREQLDITEVVAWAAAEKWSNGKVGLIGGSYAGISALLGAAQQPPALKTVVANHAYADPYRDAVSQNGMFNASFTSQWSSWQTAQSASALGEDRLTSALADTTMVTPLLTRTDGPFYRERAVYPKWEKITAPTLLGGGWRDGFSRGTVWNFQGIASEHKKLFMDPFGHKFGRQTSEPNSPYAGHFEDAEIKSYKVQVEWLNRFLHDDQNGVEDGPAVEYFDMGTRNWKTAETWPPTADLEEFQLTVANIAGVQASGDQLLDDGGLEAEPGPRKEHPDTLRFAYDPSTGSTDTLGKWGEVAASPQLYVDQRPEEARSLTYSTPSLKEPLTIAGPMELQLAASTTASDVDWVVRVSDVDQFGNSVPMTSGYLRASHRKVDDERSRPAEPWIANDDPKAVTPGKVYRYRIDVWPTAWTVQPGHRLRVSVSSADVPTHEPSPYPALNTVFHAGRGKLASHLLVSTAPPPSPAAG